MQQADFTAAVDNHYASLVQRLTLVLHDREEALDVAQEAYLRAFKAWDRFDGRDTRAWLYTIGLRLAFNALRGRRLRQAWRSGTTDTSVWIQPEHGDLWEALGHLRPEQRAALLLNVIDGYTQAEIATMLDAPEGTVAGWVSGAKTALRAEPELEMDR